MNNMNYYENPRLSYSKLKLFNNLYRNDNLTLWDKLEPKKYSAAMERGTIIHRLMDINDDIELVLLESPTVRSGKESDILAQVILDMDNEVNIEALVERIYYDYYPITVKTEKKIEEHTINRKNDFDVYFDKIKEYLTTLLECKINTNKYPLEEKLYWECINTANNFTQAEKLLIDSDVMSGRNIVAEYSELEIYWEYENVECKSKLDKVYIVEYCNVLYPIIIDYKVISQGINTTLAKFNYVSQLAFYKLALESYLEDKYTGLASTRCYLLMSNPEYTDVYTIEVTSNDMNTSIYGGFISTNQLIENYYGKKTITKYYDDWKLIGLKRSLGLLHMLDEYNKEYYVGISKLVKEYKEYTNKIIL